ncbi:unnamed protein product [Oppiella nova]|uniref:Uncharacterized protein n=1 Tax=Oppiella nova TaxID=334625 RepID=A0A7R9M4W4_9ACAR|nr:unnamed protein product [Oppiella nova]CAG2170807.1 unnamed protein product [Oppiella nova]
MLTTLTTPDITSPAILSQAIHHLPKGAILYQLQCWNATQFMDCMQLRADLTSIHQLMSTDINKHECDLLYQSFEWCRLNQMQTTKYRCTHNQTLEAVSTVHHLFDIFMSSSHCRLYYTNTASPVVL